MLFVSFFFTVHIQFFVGARALEEMDKKRTTSETGSVNIVDVSIEVDHTRCTAHVSLSADNSPGLNSVKIS